MNLETARTRGMSLIPVREDKKPLVPWKSFQERRPTDDEYARWDGRNPAAWAVVTGQVSGVVVLDFDGDEGKATLHRLGLEPHVQTPSGGFHVYVEHPGTPVSTLNHGASRDLNRAFPGMDVKGDGGYAIAFGRNRQGEYRWVGPDDFLPFENLPPEVRSLLTEGPHRPLNGPQDAPDDAGGSEDLMLEKALEMARSEGRNNALFRLACSLRDAGVPEEQAVQKGLEFASRTSQTNLKGNEGPLTESEVRATVDSAYSRPPVMCGPKPEKVAAHLEALGTLFRGRLRWCPEWKSWLLWDGKRWERVSEEQVKGQVFDTLRQAYADDYRSASDEERRRALERLNELEGGRFWKDSLELFKGGEGVHTHAGEFDQNPYLLNTPEGVLDLRTGDLRQARPDDMLTRVTASPYDPQAACPRFERFLEEVLPQPGLPEYVQRVFGLALLGENHRQELYVLYGTGANGKSTLLNVLQKVLGDYAGAIPRDVALTRREKQDAERTATVACEGLRLGILDELAEGATLSPVAVKDLTSGNPMQARGLYENYREVRLQVTPVIATNHRPRIPGQTEGVWRRLRLVPFTVQIPEGRRDPALERKLLAEAPGILRWLVEGCRLALEQGVPEPAVVMQATQEYRTDEDALADFFEAHCVFGPGCRVPFRELYAQYKRWCEAEGVEKMLTQKAFAHNLEQRGYGKRKERVNGEVVCVYRGIGLRQQEELLPDVPDSAHFQNFSHACVRTETFQKQPESSNIEQHPRPEDPLPATDCDEQAAETPEERIIRRARQLQDSGVTRLPGQEKALVADLPAFLQVNLRDATGSREVQKKLALERLEGLLSVCVPEGG